MKAEEKREVLIAFMYAKAKAIADATDGRVAPEEYFCGEDEEAIRAWKVEDVEAAFNEIEAAAKRGLDGDASWCPFCALHSNSCEDCPYGRRHGRCEVGDLDNSYGIVIDALKGSIVYRLGLDELRAMWVESKQTARKQFAQEVRNEG